MSLIPENCSFLNTESGLLTNAAQDILMGLVDKAKKRCPDAYDLYIYNDFENYGILDLVDKTLSTLHTKIIKKSWDEAMVLLEAFFMWHTMGGCNWPMVDDGERVEYTNKAIGAIVMAVLNALKDEGRLNTTSFPTLETTLRNIASWGESMDGLGDVGTPYHTVCKGIGYRLFKDKTPEQMQLEKDQLNEWINGLKPENQDDMRRQIKENEEEAEEEEEGPWYGTEKDGDEEVYDDSFVLSRSWKEYKDYLKQCPTKPLRGPPKWDLTTWSAADKAQFSLDKHGFEDDF